MSDEKKPSYQDLVRLEHYEKWYINPLSGRLVYRTTVRGRPTTIRTGIIGKLNPKTGKVDGITKAREIVEAELEALRSDKTQAQIKRERKGVINPQLDELWQEMLVVKLPGKSPGTRKNYSKEWRHGISKFWTKLTAKDVTTENVARYKSWYIDTHPERLFDKTFDFLKMFFRFIVQRKYVQAMPDLTELNELDEIIKKNKRYKKAGRVYTADERKALLESWRTLLGGKMGGTTSVNKKMRAARARLGVTMGLLCGMRVMEILSLKKSQVDFEKSILPVWSTKNHQWRDVPLVPAVIEAIKYQLEATAHQESEWLFPMPSDPTRHVSSQVFEKVWYQVRSAAGIVPQHALDARFHDLRKTFATLTAEQGWPWKVACEILDMSGEIYEKTYANRITFETKAALMSKHFGGEA
jgi:integrase